MSVLITVRVNLNIYITPHKSKYEDMLKISTGEAITYVTVKVLTQNRDWRYLKVNKALRIKKKV
jgi:hypothetical protein